MEKSETASRGGRIISNKIKLENLMRIVRLVAAIFQIAIIVSNRQSRQRLDRHGTIVVGSCETFHHYNVQGVK